MLSVYLCPPSDHIEQLQLFKVGIQENKSSSFPLPLSYQDIGLISIPELGIPQNYAFIVVVMNDQYWTEQRKYVYKWFGDAKIIYFWSFYCHLLFHSFHCSAKALILLFSYGYVRSFFWTFLLCWIWFSFVLVSSCWLN